MRGDVGAERDGSLWVQLRDSGSIDPARQLIPVEPDEVPDLDVGDPPLGDEPAHEPHLHPQQLSSLIDAEQQREVLRYSNHTSIPTPAPADRDASFYVYGTVRPTFGL